MYQESFGSAIKRGYFNMPVAIRWIITINLVVFLLGIFSGTLYGYMLYLFAFEPDPGTAFTQPWRFITYMFLHGSTFHFLFNMLWLWWMGRAVEDTLGPRNFMTLFIGAGVGGVLINLLVLNLFGMSLNPVIGASGGVLGILVCFAMLYPTAPIMLLFLPPIEARYVVAGLIALDVLLIGAADNVARLVHLGGALSGFVLLKMYYRGYNYDAWIGAVANMFKKSKKPGKSSNLRSVSDAEILEETDQTELDRILEKISKKGYEGLTDEEKKILFELSKKR
ncbi:MAG: rhomboid family intramembrane serine protease [Balneolaceae bacterium]|nr:MAG: rhomboid family intramembrane serine protease [Balneolaceae bacterium]